MIALIKCPKNQDKSINLRTELEKREVYHHFASSAMTPCMFLNNELSFIACMMLPSSFSLPES